MKQRKMFLQSLKSVFSASPKIFIFSYTMNLFDAFFMVFSLFALQNFFDSVGLWLTGAKTFSASLIALVILLLSKICTELSSGTADVLGEYYSSLCLVRNTEILNAKLKKLPIINFENKSFIRALNTAYYGAYDVRDIVHTLMDLVTIYIPYFFIMGFYLFNQNKYLPFILPMLFFPVLISNFIKVKHYDELIDAVEDLRVKENHYKDCLSSRAFLKETRALGAIQYFNELYLAAVTSKIDRQNSTDIKCLVIESISNLLTLTAFSSVVVFLVYLASTGNISVGALAAIIAGMIEMFSLMKQVFSERLGELSASIGSAKKFYDFLEFEEVENGKLFISELAEFNLNDVSFMYPGAKEHALSAINLSVKKGESVAIVGENGSGKTTLAKLALSLYKPTSGTITYNGKDLSEYKSETYRKITSAVFQNFQCYNMLLSENVSIGDISRTITDDQAIYEALVNGGFYDNDTKRSALPPNTQIGPEFGGIELSRGEWQRLSITRAFYKKHELIVLDEPTAAIDPYEEDRMYKNILKLKENHSMIIITHRLGAIKLVDKILVLKEGRVIAQGKHEDLLVNCVYYKKLWDLQSAY